jgi:hypothetical protein
MFQNTISLIPKQFIILMKANQNLHFGKKQNGEIEDESIGNGSINVNGKEHEPGANSTFFRYEYSDLKEHSMKELNTKAKRVNSILGTKHNEEGSAEADRMIMEVFGKEVNNLAYSSIYK